MYSSERSRSNMDYRRRRPRSRAYSRSISVPEPQRRRIGCIISSLVFVLFMVTAIAVTVILLRKPSQADSTKNIQEEKGPDEQLNRESDTLQDGKTPASTIIIKLKELGLRVDEDTDLNDPQLPSNDYARITEVSDSTFIKATEVAAIATKFKDANPKLSLAEEADAIKKFKTFTGKYNKKFKSLINMLERYRNFRVNYKEIEAHNKDPKNTYKKGYNKYADFSDAEFNDDSFVVTDDQTYFSSKRETTYLKGADAAAPLLKASGRSETAFDWRSENVISSVKDQGRCGASWAFAAAEAIEANYNIKNKSQRVELSAQHLLNCSGDNNCKGGDIEESFSHLLFSGVCLASDLSYEGKKNKCNVSQCKNPIKISRYSRLSKGMVFKAVKNEGPLAVPLYLSKDLFLYESGVFNGTCDRNLNQAGLLVGYGIDKKTSHKYWIVKNSWGTDWGEEGYIKVSRDTVQGDNICNIAEKALLPII